jgi:hypothetical protein
MGSHADATWSSTDQLAHKGAKENFEPTERDGDPRTPISTVIATADDMIETIIPSEPDTPVRTDWVFTQPEPIRVV